MKKTSKVCSPNFMKIRIDEILEEKRKSYYWLSKQTGISLHSIVKLCKNETTSINFKTMDKICSVLDCKPGDIFKE